MSAAADIRHWQTLTFADVDAMMRLAERRSASPSTRPTATRPTRASSCTPSGCGPTGAASCSAPGATTRRCTNVGTSAAYLVVEDPDAVFDRAVAAGATVLRPMVDQDYGGRGGSVADPEGNHWSFGSYQPSLRPVLVTETG